MTHYAQLSEAVEFDGGSGEKLVLRGTNVTLDELVDHFLADDLKSWSEEHPDIDRYHAKQVGEILDDLVRDVPESACPRRQLQQQAAWALLSERVSMLIEQQDHGLSNPPQREELPTLARKALEHLEPEAAAVAPGGSQQEAGAGEQSAGHDLSGSEPIRSRDALQRVAAELTDCSSRLRNAADQLQAHRPVHAAYTREITTRLDELLANLLPPDREG